MTAGVVLSIGGRMAINLTGVVFAVAGVAVVCLSTVQTSELGKKFKVDSTLILYNLMPPQIAMLAVVVILFEPVFPGQPNSIFEYSWTPMALFCVVATTLLALLLNVSGIAILGQFSPVTYAVVGYAKTATVLATGILVFGDELTISIFFGIVLVFGGAIWYNRAQ